jgi:hypothetical protein
MKRVFNLGLGVLLLSGLLSLQSYARLGVAFKTADNSFEDIYQYSYPQLIYSYNDATQTHSYSGNRDFDGDGQKR